MKLAIMLSFAAIFSSTAEASEYQIIPIAPPANSQLQWIQGIVNAPALNQSHQVAITYLGDDGAYHPYLWQSGALTPLPLSAGATSGAVMSINDAGVVVGYEQSVLFGPSQPVVWNGSAPTVLDQNDLPSGIARSINNAGEMVGTTAKYFGGLGFQGGSLPSSTAAYWNGASPGTFTAYDADQSLPIAINNQGQIIVNTFTRATSTSGAYLVDHGIITPITHDNSQIYLNDLNDLGQAVGTADGLPFIWQNNVLTFLQVPSDGGNADVSAINEDGAIVGQASHPADNSTYATLWQNNQLTDLNSLIPANTGWNLQLASDIANDGTIVGVGTFDGQPQAFLLTPTSSPPLPTPEPTTLPLLLTAALPLLRRHPHKSP